MGERQREEGMGKEGGGGGRGKREGKKNPVDLCLVNTRNYEGSLRKYRHKMPFHCFNVILNFNFLLFQTAPD